MNKKWGWIFLYILLMVLQFSLLAIAVIGVQTTRYVTILILLVILCVEIVISIYRKSKLWLVGILPLIAVLVSLHCYRASYDAYVSYDRFRFDVLGNIYRSMAEELASELVEAPDMAWGEYPIPLAYQPLIGEEIIVIKSGPDMMIYFPAWTTFFRTSGIVYFTTPHAFEMLDTPHHDVTEDKYIKQYEQIDWIDSSWATIKLY